MRRRILIVSDKKSFLPPEEVMRGAMGKGSGQEQAHFLPVIVN